MSAGLGRLRAALGRRSAREGANLGITAVLLFAVLVGVNYVANRRNISWDLTAGGRFSLSPQTVRILEELDRDIRLVVLDQPRAAGRTLELFERYADRSGRVAWEVIDQEAEPARARAYQATAEAGIPFGTVVVESGGRQERVTAPQEQDITNAIVRILKGETRKVYFTTGHQERSLEETGAGGLSAIGSRLEESNYEVAELALLEHVEDGEVRIPEDAAVVIVAGPRLDLLEAEAAALAAHVHAGGKAMLLLDPPDPPGTPDGREELTGLASEFGATPAGDVVIDASGVGQLFGFGVEVPLAASYGFHPITRGFVNAATVFPLAQSLIATPPDELPRGMRLSELVLSSDVAWGETDPGELETGEVAAGEDERAGPLRLAYAVHVPTGDPQGPAEEAGAGEPDPPEAAAELDPEADPDGEPDEEPAEAPEGRLVIVGDSDFIGNNLALAPLGNADLFLNMVNWLTEDEDLIAIRPRAAEDRRITMTSAQVRNVVLLSLVFLPGFFLIWGLTVWWSRR